MWLLFPHIFIVLAAEACRHGEIVLSDGKTRYEGRIDVCLNGQWNTICEDSFGGDKEVRVICRQLGFLEGEFYYKYNVIMYTVHCISSDAD